MRCDSLISRTRRLALSCLLLACTSAYGQRGYRSGAASDHYGSRRGLSHNRGGAEVNRYLARPYTPESPPLAYPRRTMASLPPFGYGNPYPYNSSYYYDISPYVSSTAARIPNSTYAEDGAADNPDLANPYLPANPQIENPAIPPNDADINSRDGLPPSSPIPASATARMFQQKAEQAFREHRFEDAERMASHAVLEDSKNGKLLLFAAQTELAVGDYEGAAALIHQATSFLPTQEWGFVVQTYQQFYRDEDFVHHMKRLDDFVRANPNVPHAQFLCGYEYMYLGHGGAARKRLQATVKLEPQDTLAEELLRMIPAIETVPAQETEANIETLPPPEPTPTGAPPQVIDPPRPPIDQGLPTVP